MPIFHEQAVRGVGGEGEAQIGLCQGVWLTGADWPPPATVAAPSDAVASAALTGCASRTARS